MEYPGWDREATRATADPIWYLDRTVDVSEQTHRYLGIQEDSIFSKGTQSMRNTRAVWAAALDKVTSGGTGVANGTGTEVTLDPTLMDVSDDPWFTDILASWNG